jgi:hypothetical protein
VCLMIGAHHFEKSSSISRDSKENRVLYASKKRRKVSEEEGHPTVISAHDSYINSENPFDKLIAIKNKMAEYPNKIKSSSYAGQMIPDELDDRNPWPPHETCSGNPPNPNEDVLHLAMHKLLDIADRIPFIGVESTSSKV